MSRDARRSNPRRAVAVASWLGVFASGACSYYSDALLQGDAMADGGAGAATTSVFGGVGGVGGTGGQSSGATAGTLSSTSGAGGTGGTGGSSSPPPIAGADNAGGAPGDISGAGQGGQAPIDECPADPNKLEPGQCGCGVPEGCNDLKAALAHRYSFTETGSVAVDSIAGANGTIVAGSASKGMVTFDGTTATYVDLPNGIVSSLKDASFEVWMVWGGGSIWQRVFDFGTNDQGEGNQGSGTNYLFLTPSDGGTGNVLRASFSTNGVKGETTVRTSAALATNTAQHLVVVVDDTNNELRLYLNGSVSAISGFTQSLSSLSDVNNWIGRSNSKDAPLKGSVDEVRIYKTALTTAQVATSYTLGPNPSW